MPAPFILGMDRESLRGHGYHAFAADGTWKRTVSARHTPTDLAPHGVLFRRKRKEYGNQADESQSQSSIPSQERVRVEQRPRSTRMRLPTVGSYKHVSRVTHEANWFTVHIQTHLHSSKTYGTHRNEALICWDEEYQLSQGSVPCFQCTASTHESTGGQPWEIVAMFLIKERSAPPAFGLEEAQPGHQF